MEAEGYAVLIHKGLDTENMVEMGMGIDNALGLQLLVCNVVYQLRNLLRAIHAGVNNPALFFFICDDISVLFKGVERKKSDI